MSQIHSMQVFDVYKHHSRAGANIEDYILPFSVYAEGFTVSEFASSPEMQISMSVDKVLPWRRRLELLGQELGIEPQIVEDLAFGKAMLEVPEEKQHERGVFASTAGAHLDARGEEARKETYHALYQDAHTFLFEEAVPQGHIERIEYPFDPVSGQGIMYGHTSFLEVYALDLARPQYRWRQRLSFVECLNEVAIQEFTRDGTLRRNVLVERSTFPYDAAQHEAEQCGYRPDNHKGYLRATYLDGEKRVVETLSMSDMRPEDVVALHEAFGEVFDSPATPHGVLSEPQLIDIGVYQECGGLGFFAAILDRAKETRQQGEYLFGESTGAVSSDMYANVMALSQERRKRAEPVVHRYVQGVLATHRDKRAGLLDDDEMHHHLNALFLKYRLEILKNDPILARERCTEKTADAIEIIRMLEASGRNDEARVLASEVQRELGTAYACGVMIRVDKDGNPVDENGNSLHCPEIKNGDWGNCPDCKMRVRIIVDATNKDKIYCSNASCKLSRSGGKKLATLLLGSVAKPQSSGLQAVR